MTGVALDSNILIYAEGTTDLAKRDFLIPLITRIGPENVPIPMPAAGETLSWLIRKGRLERSAAIRRIEWWLTECQALPVSVEAFRRATGLVEHHTFQLWDAVILAASAEAEAAVLLSEDMQHGFRWSGVTVLNPFLLGPDELHGLITPRILR